MLTRSSAFEKTILRRDLTETAAAIFVILAFGYFLRQDMYPWIAKLGMVITILGAIEVFVVLHWTRRRSGRPHYDLPLTEYCAAEIARVDRQIWLLRHVNWWYSGPMLLGACIFAFGLLFPVPDVALHISLPAFAGFCATFLIFGWMIYRINQRAVRREMIPFRKELSAISKSLLDDSPTTGDTK